ncbi:TPA: hypothetical protein ACPSKF_001816, partial [Legionella anisa]
MEYISKGESSKNGRIICRRFSLISEKKLSLTRLGRALRNKTQEKHNIKRCDRFLGNNKLHRERQSIYKEVAHQLICTKNYSKSTSYLLSFFLSYFFRDFFA